MDHDNTHIAKFCDLANPPAQDTDFYLCLAGPRPCSVLDLGCGTGILCCALAARGHQVTGVDPAAAMLAIARSKLHSERVEWVDCSAQNYRSDHRFDLIVTSGHAFQVFLTDSDALAVLETMRSHLDQGQSCIRDAQPPGRLGARMGGAPGSQIARHPRFRDARDHAQGW